MSITTQATRFRPSEPVEFRNPVRGPSGAVLLAYEWKWRAEDIVNRAGEDKVKRVSDWDRAEASSETGRDIVHQFTVRTAAGDNLTVSAEGVLRALGYMHSSDMPAFPALVRVVKQVAKLQLALTISEAQVAENARIAKEVEALPLPELVNAGRAYPNSPGSVTIRLVMGDAYIFQLSTGEPQKERVEYLARLWRGKREAERGAKALLNADRPEILRSKIRKLLRRIDAQTPSVPSLASA